RDSRSSGFDESAQNVIRRNVPDEGAAAEADADTIAASTSATSDARIRPGYCQLAPGYCPARGEGTLEVDRSRRGLRARCSDPAPARCEGRCGSVARRLV